MFYGNWSNICIIKHIELPNGLEIRKILPWPLDQHVFAGIFLPYKWSLKQNFEISCSLGVEIWKFDLDLCIWPLGHYTIWNAFLSCNMPLKTEFPNSNWLWRYKSLTFTKVNKKGRGHNQNYCWVECFRVFEVSFILKSISKFLMV